MSYAFVSYVHENEEEVQRLCRELKSHGFSTWLARNNILPGTRWKQAIRRAIDEGAFFVACFSREYCERSRSYVNEELTIAIEELRRRPTDKTWFVPVKLSECDIPDRDIGAGETLQDLQCVELYRNWNDGIRRIIDVIRAMPRGKGGNGRSGQTIEEMMIGEDNQTIGVVIHSNQLGIHTKIMVPVEATPSYLVNILRDRHGLKSSNVDEEIGIEYFYNYCFIHNGRIVVEDKTLGEAGVKDGDSLILGTRFGLRNLTHGGPHQPFFPCQCDRAYVS